MKLLSHSNVPRNSRVTRTVPIDDLKLYENSAWNLPRKQRRKIEALIRKHGQIPPILVESDLTIISGEEWVLALKNAGRTEVEVQLLADLSPIDAQVVRLALRRLPLDAHLNRDRLRAEFVALQAQGIDLELTGWDQAEIDLTLEIDMPRTEASESLDDVPQRRDRAVARLGDVFQLKCHRLGCGEANFLRQLCDHRRADACIVDPRYEPGQFGFSEADFGSFLCATLRVLGTASTTSARLYVFATWGHIFKVLAAGEYLELPLLDMAVWTKANSAMEPFHRSIREFCTVFRAVPASRNCFKMGKRGRNRSNVWDYPVPTGAEDLLGEHSTPKPVAMLADIINNCTKRGDLVIDPFLGLGGTLIAAEDTRRICIGTEPNPHLFDTTIRRWQARTGEAAIHLGTGMRFDDLEQSLLTHRGGSHGA